MPKLDNWYIQGYPAGDVTCSKSNNKYREPELSRPRLCLCGVVTGSKKFADGDNIVTSEILNVSSGGVAYTVTGTRYELGNVFEAYEKAYPGARKRLISVFETPVSRIDK